MSYAGKQNIAAFHHYAATVLTQAQPVGPFLLHFAPYKPRDGSGSADGLHPRLLQIYSKALLAASDKLHLPPHERSIPSTADNGFIPVYIGRISRFFSTAEALTTAASAEHPDAPTILLPCQFAEVDRQRHDARAFACAVHEVAHAWNWHRRHDELWTWLDEPSAVLMETEFSETRDDWLRYMAPWFERPEYSLVEKYGGYHHALFLRHLTRQPALGAGFISRIWRDAEPGESALAALRRLLRERKLTLTEPDGTAPDLFSTYCLESYFVGAFESTLAGLHEERAVSRSYDLEYQKSTDFRLLGPPPFGCSYVEFFPPAGASEVHCQIQHARPGTKAALAPVRDLARAEPGDWMIKRGTSLTGSCTLPSGTGHTLLVIVHAPPDEHNRSDVSLELDVSATVR
jgi:hypothetical protein